MNAVRITAKKEVERMNTGKMQETAVAEETQEMPAAEIGSDQDFQKRAEQRKVWATLEAGERQESTSVRRSNLMRDGFHAGYEAAASDYAHGTATVEHFEALREERDVTDFYAIGFELGFMRKLAELLVA